MSRNFKITAMPEITAEKMAIYRAAMQQRQQQKERRLELSQNDKDYLDSVALNLHGFY